MVKKITLTISNVSVQNIEKGLPCNHPSKFIIYYEINSNEFLHNERSYESDLETASIVVPTQGAYQRQGEQAKNWQKIAKAEDKQVANIFWRNTFERIVTTKIAWVKIIRKN